MKMKQDKNKTTNLVKLAGFAVIILTGIIIYSNSFDCSFHFDDYDNIVNNKKIHDLSDSEAWWNFSKNRPVSMFSFVLNYHFHKLDVRYYHLVNLIIHIINAFLVWWLTLLVLSSPALKKNKLVKQKHTLAFFTAMLFVSHPLATQAVTYIIQRQALMAAMFFMLSLAMYIKARLRYGNNIKSWLLYAGALLAFVLAALSKENAYTLPFVIILVEVCFLQTKIILMILAIAGIVFMLLAKFSVDIFAPIPPSQSMGNAETITPLNYLLTQFRVVPQYIQLMIFPVSQNLDYDVALSHRFFEMKTMLGFLFLASLVVLAVYLFNRNRIILCLNTARICLLLAISSPSVR